MYEEFYGLQAQPFNITPDPRYLFFSRRHRQAFEHILFGISERKGFIQITGEVGAGKSTLCRKVLEELREGYATALIRLVERLNEYLLERAHAGVIVALFIDEAQDMSDELLEQVRLLSNLETDEHKLVQIVLIGQPELRDRLERPELRQLRQRITVRYHLGSINRQETASYVQHRLLIAGSNGRPSFSRAALWAIHGYARGIPRLINSVCDKTLLCGYVQGRDQLGWRQVRRAIRDLEGDGW
jgi:general secretion pathway protein A